MVKAPGVALRALVLLLFLAPAAAVAQADDPVLAALGPAAEAAAAANVTRLLNDPATPVIGDAKASVAIVEFFDYACSYCKAVEPKLEALIKDDPGVKLVVKEFPILTPESLIASKAALAAAKQSKYAAFHQALMSYKGQLSEAVIFETAGAIGLDVPRLKRDMTAPEIPDALIANMNLARKLKVSMTPGLLVNSHILSGVSPNTSSGAIDFRREVAEARGR